MKRQERGQRRHTSPHTHTQRQSLTIVICCTLLLSVLLLPYYEHTHRTSRSLLHAHEACASTSAQIDLRGVLETTARANAEARREALRALLVTVKQNRDARMRRYSVARAFAVPQPAARIRAEH